MRNRFVTESAPVRLALVDVHIRAHQKLVERKAPEATPEELADAEDKIDEARADGAWIDVKPKLSAGETRSWQTRNMAGGPAVPSSEGGEFKTDFRRVGFTLIAQIVTGWNLEDDRGPVDWPEGEDDATLDARESILSHLDQQTYSEIYAAVEFHLEEQSRRRRANPTIARSSGTTSESRA